MASFTTAGDNTTLTLTTKGETVSIAISGTYAQTIKFQRALGSPNSPDTGWETVYTYSTANATVAATYTSRQAETVRLIASAVTSGTATATLTDSTDLQLSSVQGPDGTGFLQVFQSGVAIPTQSVVALTASLTLTRASHAGRTLLLNAAGGFTVTLPAATGSGDVYTFVVQTANSSTNNYVIKTAPTTDTFSGLAVTVKIATTTATLYPTVSGGSNTNTITMGGTSQATGATVGDKVELVDVAAGVWECQIYSVQGGTTATPFSHV